MNINSVMNSPHQTGYLEIILGSMYSGKSTRLIEIYNQCIFCNIPVVVINHDIDNRYDDELLSTHDKVKIPCIKTSSLKNVWKPYIKTLSNQSLTDRKHGGNCLIVKYSDVVLINEGQFFHDLYEVVNEIVNQGKHVYVCGLDGDFERKKFGQILDLIPLCDKVTKLTSLCSLCKNGTPGIFSMRLTNEKEQTVVGSHNYIPVCRKCYNA
jgi:thymidine kinase